MLGVLYGALASGSSQLSLGTHGEIEVNGKAWFAAGNISVTVGGTTYSTADASLKSAGAPTASSGSDTLGAFTSTTQAWTAGGTPYTTSARLYSEGQFVIFEQAFPKGATGTNITETTGASVVSSCYPSIDPQPVGGTALGYVSWEGRAFLEGSHGGTWDGSANGSPGPSTGDNGGTFVVFTEELHDSLVFSPASNFMTISPGMSKAPGKAVPAKYESSKSIDYDPNFQHPGAGALSEASPAPSSDGSFCFGLDAPVESVPSGYSLETIVHLGIGVNAAMKSWGTTMLKKYNTVRPVDYASEWLGFSTDNGAYYYYGWHPTATTPDYQNYQEAMTGVHDYSVKENIPYKHLLLDSWWYTKGDAGGLKEWDATNSTFPDGLAPFAKKTGWKFQMHNRHWSDNNVYAKQNGGNYDFVLDPAPAGSGMAMPLGQHLWDDLMSNKTENGIPLSVYEQDWLYNEWRGVAEARASPTLSRQWLMQMGTGATKSNTTVQYCMSLARHVLQSIEIPAVTTFRASDDYGPGQTGYYPTRKPGKPPTNSSTGCTFPYCVYYVGTTSIIAHALQLKPSKDNYWSTPLQRGSAFNRNPYQPTMLNDTHEPYNEMQSAISSYTTAMVAPSDGVGFSNASLIKMACRSDGRLLQPSAPARAIDASFALSGAPVNHVKNVHSVMATHTEIGGVKWPHILVIGLSEPFKLLPEHLSVSGDIGTGPAVAWTGYQPSDTVGKGGRVNVTLLIGSNHFSDDHPLTLTPCGYSNFGLYHISPIHPLSQLALLGELGKWVPVADDRIVAVKDSADGLAVDIIGEKGETVELAFADATLVSTGVCTFGATGKATMTWDGKQLPTCATE